MQLIINGIEISLNDDQVSALVTRELTKPQTETRALIAHETGLILPPLGEYWDGQGGVNHGLYRDADGKTYWLLAAVHEIEGAWGRQGTTIDGEFSHIDGAHNTGLMLAADLPLAKEIRAYSADGHADFYLGSSREMHLARTNQDKHWKPKWYWTSTQYSARFAWIQWFDDGIADASIKDDVGLARPFRRLPFSNPVIQ